MIIMLGSHLLTWRLYRQQSVSLLTTKAEYKALGDGCKEAIWHGTLFEELTGSETTLVDIAINNKGAYNIATSRSSHNCFRSKHIDIRLHFIRELVANNTISLRHIPTGKNKADFLTKPLLGPSLLSNLRQVLGVPVVPSKGGCEDLPVIASARPLHAKRKHSGSFQRFYWKRPEVELSRQATTGPTKGLVPDQLLPNHDTGV